MSSSHSTMMGNSHMGAAANITSINLAGTNSRKKVQTTDDILKQIEASMPDSSEGKYKQESLSQTIRGRIDQHEAAFGDAHLPRSRLPKVDAGIMDRYQAARRNVLLLGAIQAASGPSTKRSNKTAAAKTPHPDHSLAGEGSEGDGALSVGGGVRDSRFTSFAGRSEGRTAEVTPEASELLGPPGGQSFAGSRIGSRAGSAYHMRHQASTRSANSSFAGSTTSGTTAASRHMTRQNSELSAGSGHTARTEVTISNRARTHRNRKTPRKKVQKPKPGRVAVALAEFGQKDDWLSKTLLRHYLASVIQACWRGYCLRKRWAQPDNRSQVVEEVKAKNSAEDERQQRLRDMQHKLMAHQQKQLAKAATEATQAAEDKEGAEGGGPAAGVLLPPIGRPTSGKGDPASRSRTRTTSAAARRRPAASRAPSAGGNAQKLKYLKSVKLAGQSEGYQPELSDSSGDSGWSDIELEDVATIKFRAVTPPWQKRNEGGCMSKQLKQRTAAAAAAATGKQWPPVDLNGLSLQGGGDNDSGGLLGVLWSEDNRETNSRLQELRHRRICRKPKPVLLSEAATAAAAASGLLGSPAAGAAESIGGVPGAATGDTDFPLSSWAVEQLMLERYSTKYNRLGVPEQMPGRERWIKQQLVAREAAKAAAAATTAVNAHAAYPVARSGASRNASVADGAAAGTVGLDR